MPLYAKPEQEKTVTPTASGVVVTPDADYTLSKITVNGDSNLTAGNIKSGVKIFGVTGTYNNAKPEQTKTVDLSMASGNQVVSPDSGKVLSKVTVNKPSTLIPDNIKKDVNIGGVIGTLESGGGSGFPNGTEWTQSNITTGTFYSVANANGLWVTGSGNGLYYSIDGKTWTQSNVTADFFNSMLNANGIWVIGSSNGIYYSVSWEPL